MPMSNRPNNLSSLGSLATSRIPVMLKGCESNFEVKLSEITITLEYYNYNEQHFNTHAFR